MFNLIETYTLMHTLDSYGNLVASIKLLGLAEEEAAELRALIEKVGDYLEGVCRRDDQVAHLLLAGLDEQTAKAFKAELGIG